MELVADGLFFPLASRNCHLLDAVRCRDDPLRMYQRPTAEVRIRAPVGEQRDLVGATTVGSFCSPHYQISGPRRS